MLYSKYAVLGKPYIKANNSIEIAELYGPDKAHGFSQRVNILSHNKYHFTNLLQCEWVSSSRLWDYRNIVAWAKTKPELQKQWWANLLECPNTY